MQQGIHRYTLLLTGISLLFIGFIYCIDPNLLLTRYELSVASASDDNMYRGAYGGLFITMGGAIAYGFYAAQFLRNSTIIALLFMSGFAIGRIASIATVGLPHSQILGLLIFEIVTTIMFGWFLVSGARSRISDQPQQI